MINKYEEQIYRILKYQPVTPNEIANKLNISFKTAQRALLELAATKDDIGYKKSGRIHLFWFGEKTNEK